jgi:hypothetical protein
MSTLSIRSTRSTFVSMSVALGMAAAMVGHEAPARAADDPASTELKVSYDAALAHARRSTRATQIVPTGKRGAPASAAVRHTPLTAPAAPPFAAPHPPTAQLRVPYAGAPTLTSPRIIPVIFPADPQAALIADFTARLTTGAYWGALAEYGIGPGSAAPPGTASAPAPTTWADVDLAGWVGYRIGLNDPAFPAPDTNTVYAIFLPPGTTVTTQLYTGATVRTSCVDFDGYHGEAPLASGATVPLVVIPRCASFGSLTGDDVLSVAAGSQLAQAAVNPYPVDYPAFGDVTFDGSELGVVYGPEVAALCSSSTTPITRPQDLGYAVPRLWSNAAAAASHDPCVPSVSDVYFNAAPVVGGTTTGCDIYARGLSVEPGREATIPLALFSDAPTHRWELSVTTVPATTDAVKTELDANEGKNGDTVHLTVRRKRGAIAPVQVVITSRLGGRTNQATLLVGR